MKTVLLVLALTSFAAQAENVFTGGFGTDGASGMSMPKETSVNDAVKVYEALTTTADASGEKTIMLADESEFSCEKPKTGTSRLSAGCQMGIRESQKTKFTPAEGLSGKVSFSGELAQKLYDALNVVPMVTIGSSNKKVANILCVKMVTAKKTVTCTVRDTNGLMLDVGDI